MKHWIVTMAITSALVIAPLAFAEKQPHMEHALKDLQNAKKQLEEADHDKGGHRVKAIALVKEAISETTKGIAAGAA